MTIEIIARPGLPRLGILRVEERGLTFGIAAPAEKGKANDELIATIALLAKVSRSEVSIIRGTGTRNKVIRIASADATTLAARLARIEAKQR